MKLLQTNFPDEVNSKLKLAKAVYDFRTLQETLIDLCEKQLDDYIKKGQKQQ